MRLLDQLPALLGVVVGVVLSYVSGGLTARVQWQRTLSVRWDTARLAAYVDFLAEAKTIAMITLRISVARGFRTDKDPAYVAPLEMKEGYILLAEADSRRSAKMEPILLLGDAATIESAQILNELLRRLNALARDDNFDAATWREARIDYLQARTDFYHHARRNLGVPRSKIALATAYTIDPLSPRDPG